MSGPAEQAALDAMVQERLAAEGWDINTPYPAAEYLQDLAAVAQAPVEDSGPRAVWRNPQSGHVHVLQCAPEHLYRRIYQRLMDRCGPEVGGGRALRACALVAFFNRCRAALDAAGLNWLGAAQGEPERKLAFLDFLLRHPVPRERQFHPEAIPASAIEEFLAQEARRS